MTANAVTSKYQRPPGEGSRGFKEDLQEDRGPRPDPEDGGGFGNHGGGCSR